ncbi:hypothetical protein RFF05_14580 [Bengtsoniella intestinalis]|uniref:hypothetical protein n=1 Tax=Bengtsoniella intestinalis TaxID=3073143 RepID=UPI00391F6B18
MSLNVFFGKDPTARYERMTYIKELIKKWEKGGTILILIMSLFSFCMMLFSGQMSIPMLLLMVVIMVVNVFISGKIMGKIYGWTWYMLKIRELRIDPDALLAGATSAALFSALTTGSVKSGLKGWCIGAFLVVFIGLFFGYIAAIRYEIEYLFLKKKVNCAA